MNWQFCTLNQAKALKELGVTQKSLFYWNKPKSVSHPEYIHFGWTSDAIASAFNAAELIEMHGPGLQHFSDHKFPADQLANDLISDIRNFHSNIKTINTKMDKLFADKFPALSDNLNVVKSIT